MGFVRPSKIQERALPLMLMEPYVAIAPFERQLLIDFQANKHDRPIPSWDRKNSSLHSGHAEQD